MGDGNYLARYSFLPQGIPISFHVQREGQLPKGLLWDFFFYSCNSVCGPAHPAKSRLKTELLPFLLVYVWSLWQVYGSLSLPGKNSVQSTPVRLSIGFALHMNIWNK